MGESTGMGSSGSWRHDDEDSTHSFKERAVADKDYKEAAKVSAFKERQRDHVHYQPVSVRAREKHSAAARAHRNLKPMRFVSLHHHSTFSFLDGYQLPEAHVRRAAELNMQALAMTEHGNIFSHVKLEKAAADTGVKPIYGCEVYMGWTDEDRRTQMKNHLTIIAKNETGYRNLLALVSRSWSEGFHYEPTVDPRWLVEHQEGLVVLSGCQGSALFTACVGGKHVPEEDASYRRGLRVAKWFSDRLTDYFIEVQAFPELDKTCKANPILARIANEIKRPLVATMDCHYTVPEESEIQPILHNIRPGNKQTLEDQVRSWGYKAPLCPPETDNDIYRKLRATGLTKEQAIQAIVSTEEIAQECNVVLPKVPHVQYPTEDPHALWEDWLREGWRYRGCHRMPPELRDQYRKQLQHEKALIEEKGYVGYFLIVADAVRYAKDNQIPVGPARGSAGGSLVCYLLRITEVDPLQFPLLQFERFIDKTREDMPDIDMDFAPSGLPAVRAYLEDKYGKESVGSVGSFAMFKPKASVDAAARVFRVPKFEAERLKGLLLERSSGDLRASAGVQDSIEQFDEARAIVDKYPDLRYAMDLEGNATAHGTHAAGLVISNGPINQVTAVLERKVKGEMRSVIAMDKYDAARQGLEKLDFLSLATMEAIAEVLRQLDKPLEYLYSIPLDDEEMIRGFQEVDTVGVFQFEGRTMRFLAGLLKPDNFDEIAHATALCRPGPMLSGSAQQYVAVKNGADFEHVHPALDEVTKATNGQVIFQEQILSIVRDIGGFDYTHRAKIRKIISAKKGEQEFQREWMRFRDGAKDLHGMDEDTARQVWNIMATAGAYAFNAAHSYAYGMLAAWCMYLKRHHPTQFYAGALAKLNQGSDKSEDRHDTLRRDAHKKGIEILPPNKDSGISWRGEGNKLIAGWSQVPGIGPVMAEKIANYTGPDLTEISGVGAKTVERIHEFQNSPDPFGVERMERAIEQATELAKAEGLPVPTHNAAEALAAHDETRFVLALVPTHRNLRELFEVHRARTGEELDPATVKNPDASEWVLMPCRDDTDSLQLIFTRNRYASFKKAIWGIELNKDVVLVDTYKMTDNKGKGSNDKRAWGGGSGIFHVNKMWVITPDEQ